ncbi:MULTISPECIES: PPC domain-containing DNA-binding protein [unclassified Spirillospora]|uniref:PPC domain-containing DNA-binding protein n=1 Tax=unclassified Spirillospora TaxID=2642701 RepID=UPI0037139A38
MRTSLLTRAPAVPDETRIFSIRLEPGDEIMERLGAFAADESVERGVFEALGGFEEFTLARYDVPTGRFVEIPIPDDQVEVLNLTGQVTLANDPPVHVHAVLGGRDGNAFGGHLLRAVVQPVLLVTLTEPVHDIEPHHA